MKLTDLKKASEGGRIGLDKLPVEFVATLEKERVVKNDDGSILLYWDLKAKIGNEEGTVTQKFSKMHLGELANALEKLGLKSTEEAVGKTFKFRQKLFRQGFPRWLPIEKA